jgi:indoleacetamide hydrolase
MVALAELGVRDAAAAIGAGEITAEALAEALLKRCADASSLNAFIHLDPDAVRAAARRADAQRQSGQPVGPLHGVPLAIKDNIDTAELPTTGGTPGLRGNRPKHNAHVVQRLLDGGAIVLGKANMHELAYGVTNNNGAFGPARNPYDPSRIPGGSSGGTGVAVAARLAPGGLGSDTGGSVRIPAAHCGILLDWPGTLVVLICDLRALPNVPRWH